MKNLNHKIMYNPHILKILNFLFIYGIPLVTFAQQKWQFDESRFSSSMTITAIAVNDNEEMRSAAIEIGAFCGDDCRGSVLLRYEENMDKYFCFLLIHGDGAESITLKVYDHDTGEEYEANNEPLTFTADAIHGEPLNPYVIALGTTDDDYIPQVNGVTVTPAFVTLHKGATFQFSATVAGDDTDLVTWTVSGNDLTATKIDDDGLLTVAAGETAATLTITAISFYDDTKYGTATVTVPTALIFDDYVVTKWDNTFVLNIAKLEDEGNENIECDWYRDGELIHAGISYSAGETISDKLNGVYHFELTTSRGTQYSTDKIMSAAKAALLHAYPNPVHAGSVLTLEGIIAGSAIEVYSQTGTLVKRAIATGGTDMISINVPAGLYIIRTNNGELKIVVE